MTSRTGLSNSVSSNNTSAIETTLTCLQSRRIQSFSTKSSLNVLSAGVFPITVTSVLNSSRKFLSFSLKHVHCTGCSLYKKKVITPSRSYTKLLLNQAHRRRNALFILIFKPRKQAFGHFNMNSNQMLSSYLLRVCEMKKIRSVMHRLSFFPPSLVFPTHLPNSSAFLSSAVQVWKNKFHCYNDSETN